MPMKKRLLAVETLALYVLPPLLILAGFLPKAAVMPLLWAGLLYVYVIMRRSGQNLFRFHIDRSELVNILKRFAVLGPLLGLFTWLFYPELLFFILKTHPLLWLMIMVLYPLFSALAQEVLFRAFFAYRYADLIRNEQLFILFNALLFAYVHSLFGNLIAVVFSFLGAVMFMHTYLRSRSLLSSTFEHALYGNLIFTLGIGQFFYHGAS